jgi:hypothetical protein
MPSGLTTVLDFEREAKALPLRALVPATLLAVLPFTIEGAGARVPPPPPPAPALPSPAAVSGHALVTAGRAAVGVAEEKDTSFPASSRV